jgi:hypothetical protein
MCSQNKLLWIAFSLLILLTITCLAFSCDKEFQPLCYGNKIISSIIILRKNSNIHIAYVLNTNTLCSINNDFKYIINATYSMYVNLDRNECYSENIDRNMAIVGNISFIVLLISSLIAIFKKLKNNSINRILNI